MANKSLPNCCFEMFTDTTKASEITRLMLFQMNSIGLRSKEYVEWIPIHQGLWQLSMMIIILLLGFLYLMLSKNSHTSSFFECFLLYIKYNFPLFKTQIYTDLHWFIYGEHCWFLSSVLICVNNLGFLVWQGIKHIQPL
jgi:hypothetical protein